MAEIIIEEIKMELKWIAIDVSIENQPIPKKGEEVLGWDSDYPLVLEYRGWFGRRFGEKQHQFRETIEEYGYYSPTHWARIPTP